MSKLHWHEIEGWCSGIDTIYTEAVAHAAQGATFIEIGSWLGRSAVFMAEQIHASGKKLHLFAVDDGVKPWADKVTYAGKLHDNLFAAGALDVVTQIVSKSANAARLFSNNAVDLVMVDGDHTYAGTLSDLLHYWPLVIPGGVLAGHDYCNPDFPEVRQAVHDFFQCSWLQWAGTSTCWGIRKKTRMQGMDATGRILNVDPYAAFRLEQHLRHKEKGGASC